MFHSEGEKAIRALRMMLRQTAACEHTRARGMAPGQFRASACDSCVERDYQAALELARGELEKERKPADLPGMADARAAGIDPETLRIHCASCGRDEQGWRYGRCPDCGEPWRDR